MSIRVIGLASLVPVAAYVAFLFIKVILLYRKIKTSESWIETVGTIMAATVDSQLVKSSRMFWASLTYFYPAGGRKYIGKSKVGNFLRNLKSAEKIAAEHPVGSTLVVRYNPENPQEFVSEYDRSIRQPLTEAVSWLVMLVIVTTVFIVNLIT